MAALSTIIYSSLSANGQENNWRLQMPWTSSFWRQEKTTTNGRDIYVYAILCHPLPSFAYTIRCPSARKDPYLCAQSVASKARVTAAAPSCSSTLPPKHLHLKHLSPFLQETANSSDTNKKRVGTATRRMRIEKVRTKHIGCHLDSTVPYRSCTFREPNTCSSHDNYQPLRLDQYI